jgi:hypothetical protein
MASSHILPENLQTAKVIVYTNCGDCGRPMTAETTLENWYRGIGYMCKSCTERYEHLETEALLAQVAQAARAVGPQFHQAD